MIQEILRKKTRQLKEWVAPEGLTYQNTVLPPRVYRLCGEQFQDDEYFLTSAEKEADRLIQNLGLTSKSRILDLGCGYGRLAIGILRRLKTLNGYCGIDVNRSCIRWCRSKIERANPRFQFIHVNVQNDRYNPKGRSLNVQFRFPLEDQTFDIIYLFSVFSHMRDEDVRVYLSECRRLLKPTGKIFLTAFVEDNVPEMSINPLNYKIKASGPLHCVRYNRSFFEKLLSERGFQNDRLHGTHVENGQSGFYVHLIK